MKERKNIEHLFQEKLGDYQVNPPDEVWNSIEKELKKKKERKRIIPFWWKLSGVAAILFVGYSLYTTVSSSNDILDNSLKEKNNSISQQEKSINKGNSNSNINKESERDKEIITTNKPNNSDYNSESLVTTNNNASSKNNDAVTKQNELTNSSVPTLNTKSVVTTSKNSGSNNDIIAKQQNGIAKTTRSKSKDNGSTISNNPGNNVIDPVVTNKAIAAQKSEKPITKKDENSIVINDQKNNSRIIKNTVDQKVISNQNEVTLSKENNTQDDKIAMKNHSDVVLTKGDIEKKTDSTAIAKVEPNSMEELLKEKENKSTQKQKVNRWQVAPNLSPVYFGSIQNASPLDESLNDNPKDFKTTSSYGLSINYAITNKIKVRTGVNVFSINYDTQGIVFYQDANARMMKNISPSSSGSMIQIEPLDYVNTTLSRVVNERFDGVLNQRMGYIEMPVEMAYKLLDKKFGFELIGGFSTLFLNENEIFLRSDGLNTRIGTATNLNNLHFSTNLGLGINYRLIKNLDARIEPTFKYQINTFSSNTTEFRPYIFGIYSGISYRF